jgi:outer membrane lipoprotein-sorting protein
MKNSNRFLVLFLVLALFILAGCTSQQSKTDGGQTSSGETTGLNESLTGADLLKSLKFNYPDSLKTTSKTTGFGMDATVTTYVKGDNSRMETEMPGIGKQITIYNANDGMVYQYLEGQTAGTSMNVGNLTADLSTQSLEDGVASLSDLASALPANTTARVETLDGEKVIYIETTENDAQNGTVTMKMWFSTKYGIPMKYEMVANNSLLMSSVVTDVSTDNIADSQFTPPANITFTDFSNMDLNNLQIPGTDTSK